MNAAAIQKTGQSVSLPQCIKTTYVALSELFGRATEALPGPIPLLYSPTLAKESSAVDLLASWIADLSSEPPVWNGPELSSIQQLLDTLLQAPDSLRLLDYRSQDRAFFFVKGSVQTCDPKRLEEKISRLEEVLQSGGAIDPADKLTSRDCGALDSASSWHRFLKALKEQGVLRIDPLIDQWERIALLANSPFIQELDRQSKEVLLQAPVALFLAGKKEWVEGKLHTNLNTLSWADMLRYITCGNGTHTGFFVKKEDASLFVSHQIESHQLHLSGGFLGGLPAAFCLNLSIVPLVAAKEQEGRLQHYFLEALREEAILPRDLDKPWKAQWIFSMIFGIKTPFTETSSLPKESFCTTYVAKLLLKAWEKTNDESISLSGKPLLPLFGSHDAINRMTISQLLSHLKALGVISRRDQCPFLEGCLNRDALAHYWEGL